MRRAVYPGTFDPLTSGHEDIVRRAAALFDEVVLAIADSRSKKPFFTAAERIDMSGEVLADARNVKVVGFSGLLIDLVKRENANVILRGVRSVTDFDYEFQLAGMNRNLLPGVETVFLIPGEKHMFVSGTLIREIATFGGDIEKFVHPVIAARLRAKVAGG